MKRSLTLLYVLGGLVFTLLVVGCASNSSKYIELSGRSLEEVIVHDETAPVSIRRMSPEGQVLPVLERERRDASTQQYEPSRKDKWYWNPKRRYQVFRDYGVNPTILTEAKPDSTFALDVDDGSYKLALSMLDNQQLPYAEGIRVEEFVNAQEYRYLPGDAVFSLSAEAMPSPFREGYHILHLGLQSKIISDEERLPANIVLVADVSGSMASDNKLQLLKQAFNTLVSQLGKDDLVALVAYSDKAKLVLAPTKASKKRKISQAITKLKIRGSTNAAAGIRMAYNVAEGMYQAGFINRIIFSSDGMANVGATSPEEILSQVQSYREKGIFLTTVGVGLGMYNDAMMEQLADQGDGHYLYLGGPRDIQSAFVDKLNTQLQTIAKNAKAQIIFNDKVVSHYRLLGYENRALEKHDFLDASKDGGEIGAGHRVTAIYELKLVNNNGHEPLGSFSVAYQKPAGRQVFTITKEIPASIVKTRIADASSDMKLSASAAAFAEKLRMSYWSGLYDYQDVLSLLASLPSSYMRSQQVQDLRQAINRAGLLDNRHNPYREKISTAEFNLDYVPLLQ